MYFSVLAPEKASAILENWKVIPVSTIQFLCGPSKVFSPPSFFLS